MVPKYLVAGGYIGDFQPNERQYDADNGKLSLFSIYYHNLYVYVLLLQGLSDLNHR